VTSPSTCYNFLSTQLTSQHQFEPSVHQVTIPYFQQPMGANTAPLCGPHRPHRASLTIRESNQGTTYNQACCTQENNMYRRGCSVGIAMHYALVGRGSIPGRGRVHIWCTVGLGPILTPTQFIPVDFPSGAKLQRREGNHSLPSSAKGKQRWSYTSTSPYVLLA
jgi:hypothetical protein